MDRSDRRQRHRSPLWLVRAFVEVALVGVILVGLGGVILGRVVPALGHPVYVVAGPSMEPAIGLGAAVILETVDPAALAVGDVVSLRSGTGRAVFTHRIIRIADRDGAVWVETKGDANAEPDPSITPATAIVGRVTTVVPVAGYLLTLLSAPAGVLLVLSLGATLIVLGWFLESIAIDRRACRGSVPAPAVAIPPVQVPTVAAAGAPDSVAPAPPVLSRPAVPSIRTSRAERRAANRLSSDTIRRERQRLTRARAVGRGT